MVKSLEAFERFCGRLVLDNRQQMTLEAFQKRMLADYFSGCRETVISLPKGSSKTTTLAAVALWELISDADCEMAVVAASRDQAALLLRQLQGFVQRTPGLQSRMRLKQREAVNPKTGGHFRVLASDTDTLDGLILTAAIGDEIHRWPEAEKWTILLAGVQKRGGRLLGISTAGVRGESLLWQMRERALELGARRDGAYLGLRASNFCWHEWSLPDDADHKDIAQVQQANPASWITEDLLRERFESPGTTDLDWRRFTCNMFVDRAEIEAIIDFSIWMSLVDRNVQPLPPVCLAVDAVMDRSSAAIAVATFTDDTCETALVDVTDHGAGIGWTIERLLDLSGRYNTIGVVVDPGGPANALIPRLQEFGLVVHQVNARELAQACGTFYDAVAQATVRHRGSEPLNQGIQGAVKRPLGQSWAFDRRKAISDPSPLLAAVLAHYGLRTHGPISATAHAERFGGDRVVA